MDNEEIKECQDAITGAIDTLTNVLAEAAEAQRRWRANTAWTLLGVFIGCIGTLWALR